MVDEERNGNAGGAEESFAELLESYEAGPQAEIQVGDRISGKIISVDRGMVFMDTGTRADGFVSREELLDEEGEFPYAVGDTLELYVVELSDSEIRLSRAVSGAGSLRLLIDAYRNEIPVEGRVTEPYKGGFVVEVMKRRAFCPISQMDLNYIEDPEPYVGQGYRFLITALEDKGRNIVISRRRILEEEQEAARREFLAQVTPGEVLDGRVTKIMPFGAFVELHPGVEGLVHVSELGWSRVENPEDVVRVGDGIKVKLLEVEGTADTRRLRLSLSLKQVSDDPWNTVAARIKPGEVRSGRVRRCAEFGAFVELEPGIEGLVHISEMSYSRRVAKVEDVVRPGDEVSVSVKEVDTERRRISLSLRDAEGDPWAEVSEKYRPGVTVAGVVEKHERFGVFVSLEPGVTGLVPRSRMGASPEGAALDKAKEGEGVNVTIEAIDMGARRISLVPAGAGEAEDWGAYASGGPRGGGGTGSLGDLLRQAMDKKEKE